MLAIDYRNSLSWLAAIKLSKPLTLLIEELPSQEDHGLIMTIQALMVEVPAMIALDLLDNSDLRRVSLFKLEAAIEVVDHVYPALDTLESRTAVETLIARSFSDSFAELKILPAPPPSEELEVSTPLQPEDTDYLGAVAGPQQISVTADEAQTTPSV